MKFSNIEDDIRSIYNQSSCNSGCSYEIFVQKFSESVDYELINVGVDVQVRVIEIARRFGYLAPREINEMLLEWRKDGSCVHGLDSMTCPCGCFEHDFDDD